MVKEINIADRKHVEKINKLACSAPYNIWIYAGASMLNAKSLLGLYTFIGKRVNIIADDSVDEHQFDQLVELMV